MVAMDRCTLIFVKIVKNSFPSNNHNADDGDLLGTKSRVVLISLPQS